MNNVLVKCPECGYDKETTRKNIESGCPECGCLVIAVYGIKSESK